MAAPLWEDDATRDMCAPFIEWCRIAYAYGVGENNLLHLPVPHPIEPSARLRQERVAMAKQDLPLRFQYGVQLADPALGQVVQALEGFRDTYVAREEAAEAREAARQAAINLPSRRWPETYVKLLRLCQVETEQALPAVWKAMAGHSPKLDRATIQQYLSVNCEVHIGPSGADDRIPEITPDLATQLGQLRFISTPSAVEVGLSIFMVSYPDAKLAAKVSASSGLYNQQMQSNAHFTLKEVIDIKKAQKFMLPTDFIGVKYVCWCYHCVLAILLGFEHIITVAFGKLVRVMESNEQRLYRDFKGNVQYCLGFSRFIQIEMYEWMSTTLAGHEAKVPDFTEVVEDIKRQRWQVPSMPADFLDETTRAGFNTKLLPSIKY